MRANQQQKPGVTQELILNRINRRDALLNKTESDQNTKI